MNRTIPNYKLEMIQKKVVPLIMTASFHQGFKIGFVCRDRRQTINISDKVVGVGGKVPRFHRYLYTCPLDYAK
jgi:hypothetical protein